ncbi:putative cytochrome P450 oxidoreductase OrdA-like protein [Xylaria nigripes]|nr:putative cytochrome P450 oxidoreductase OrdA-like protein [Xylaria nigripes]
MTVLFTISFGLGIVCFAVILLRDRLNRPRLPLPPGPKGLPLVGNLYDFPKPGVSEAIHWSEHKKLYGPISSVTIWGQTVIIINDAQTATELLDKRSAKHSSRPHFTLTGELYVSLFQPARRDCQVQSWNLRALTVVDTDTATFANRVGWENIILMSPYNKRLRIMRKSAARAMGTHSAVAHAQEIQTAETAHLLLRMLDSPADFLFHIRQAVGGTILKLVYGYTTDFYRSDSLIVRMTDALKVFSDTAKPGLWMVDTFPALKWLPEWLPGTTWKKSARQWKNEFFSTVDLAHAFVKHQMASGMHETSYLSELITIGDSDPEIKENCKWTSLTLYAGGFDTTTAAISWFFLAMSIYPEAQKRGQEEIDRVIGKDRLPTLADRDKLPYVDATVREIFRWRPPLPTGFPHESTEDDTFEGYFIPKGSMLMANIWQIVHDPDFHQDPEVFRPDRFLAIDGHEPERDTYKLGFGFGRRICAGMALADQYVFLIVAQSLAVFNIGGCAEDAECNAEMTDAVVTHPLPFKTTIKPRSPHHEKMIRSLEDVYPWQESDMDVLERIAQERDKSVNM